MGLRYRKSKTFKNGFRINFSKSGVGYSWGTKGYRITKTAKGGTRQTISIPGTGISYVTEHGKRKRKAKSKASGNVNSRTSTPKVAYKAFLTPIKLLRNELYADLTRGISRRLKINYLSNFLLWMTVISPVFPPLFIGTAVGILLKVLLCTKFKINIRYEDYVKEQQDYRLNTWLYLCKNQKLYQLIHKIPDRQGYSEKIETRYAKVKISQPYFVSADTGIIQLKLYKEKYLFLPDKIIVLRKLRAGVIDYSSFAVNCESNNYIIINSNEGLHIELYSPDAAAAQVFCSKMGEICYE